MRPLPALAASLIFASCAAAPLLPLAADSPASVEAAAGAPAGRHSSLRADEATLRSHALLSSAAKAQKQWDEEGRVSGASAPPGVAARPDAVPGSVHAK